MASGRTSEKPSAPSVDVKEVCVDVKAPSVDVKEACVDVKLSEW